MMKRYKSSSPREAGRVGRHEGVTRLKLKVRMEEVGMDGIGISLHNEVRGFCARGKYKNGRKIDCLVSGGI